MMSFAASWTDAAEYTSVAPEITSFSAVWLATMESAHSARSSSFRRSLSPEEAMAQSVILPLWTVIVTSTVLKLLTLWAV